MSKEQEKPTNTDNRWDPFTNNQLEILRDSLDLNSMDERTETTDELFEELTGEIDRRWNEAFRETSKRIQERAKGQGPIST